jgi:small ligand-binding sensory domain FIST
MNSSLPPPSSALADDARAAVHRLSRCVRDGEFGSPAELYRVLGAVRMLTDDLTQLLPGLQNQLESGLLSGQVVRRVSGDAEAATWESVVEVGRALAQARTVALLLLKELDDSQTALRDLGAP